MKQFPAEPEHLLTILSQYQFIDWMTKDIVVSKVKKFIYRRVGIENVGGVIFIKCIGKYRKWPFLDQFKRAVLGMALFLNGSFKFFADQINIKWYSKKRKDLPEKQCGIYWDLDYKIAVSSHDD